MTLKRSSPIILADTYTGRLVACVGDTAFDLHGFLYLLSGFLQRGAVRVIRMSQLYPRPDIYTLTTKTGAKEMSVRMPHKTTDEARAEATYYGHTQSATEVFVPLASGWFSFERNAASLALWGMYATARHDRDAWEAVLHAGISTWHACEITLMDQDHRGLVPLLEQRPHAARYILSFTQPNDPIRARVMSFEARNRIRSILYTQRGA